MDEQMNEPPNTEEQPSERVPTTDLSGSSKLPPCMSYPSQFGRPALSTYGMTPCPPASCQQTQQPCTPICPQAPPCGQQFNPCAAAGPCQQQQFDLGADSGPCPPQHPNAQQPCQLPCPPPPCQQQQPQQQQQMGPCPHCGQLPMMDAMICRCICRKAKSRSRIRKSRSKSEQAARTKPTSSTRVDDDDYFSAQSDSEAEGKSHRLEAKKTSANLRATCSVNIKKTSSKTTSVSRLGEMRQDLVVIQVLEQMMQVLIRMDALQRSCLGEGGSPSETQRSDHQTPMEEDYCEEGGEGGEEKDEGDQSPTGLGSVPTYCGEEQQETICEEDEQRPCNEATCGQLGGRFLIIAFDPVTGEPTSCMHTGLIPPGTSQPLKNLNLTTCAPPNILSDRSLPFFGDCDDDCFDPNEPPAGYQPPPEELFEGEMMIQNGITSIPNEMMIQNGRTSIPNEMMIQNGRTSIPNEMMMQNGRTSIPNEMMMQNGRTSIPNEMMMQNGLNYDGGRGSMRNGELIMRNGVPVLNAAYLRISVREENEENGEMISSRVEFHSEAVQPIPGECILACAETQTEECLLQCMTAAVDQIGQNILIASSEMLEDLQALREELCDSEVEGSCENIMQAFQTKSKSGGDVGDCDCCYCRATRNLQEKSGLTVMTPGTVACNNTDDCKQHLKTIVDSIIADLEAMEKVRTRDDNNSNNQFMDRPRITPKHAKRSFPVTIKEVSELGASSLFVKWIIHDCFGIGGYEIYVDGFLTNRYFNSKHEAAVVCDVDVGKPHKVAVVAKPKGGNGKSIMAAGDIYQEEKEPPVPANWSPSIFLYEPAADLDYCKKFR